MSGSYAALTHPRSWITMNHSHWFESTVQGFRVLYRKLENRLYYYLFPRFNFQEKSEKIRLTIFFFFSFYCRFVRSSTGMWIIFNGSSWTRCVDATRWRGNFDTSRPRWGKTECRSSTISRNYHGHRIHAWS